MPDDFKSNTQTVTVNAHEICACCISTPLEKSVCFQTKHANKIQT